MRTHFRESVVKAVPARRGLAAALSLLFASLSHDVIAAETDATSSQTAPGARSQDTAAPSPQGSAVLANPSAQDRRSSGKPHEPTGSTVINLIRMLVQEGVLTQEKAEALIRQAQDEAAAAARSPQDVNGNVFPETAPVASGTGSASAPKPTSIRVPYIPQIVRAQIRDELKEEVLKQAENEHWAAPNALPEWTQRFHLFGDFRLRYEFDLFDPRNSPDFPKLEADFPNFEALDSGAPFDLNNAAGTPPPILDTIENRQQMRIRFRLGMNVDVTDNFMVGIRMATGNTVNPVSTNQTLGTTLNKDNILLDLGYLQYEPVSWAKLWFGRFPNPWLYTDLIWDNTIAFDGVADQISTHLFRNFSLFSTSGAFPIQNTPFNFPDNSVSKGKSYDKWLFAGQAGFDWQFNRHADFKMGAAYYYFWHLEGQLSAPCVANSASDVCSTDDSRPGWLQQGNTLFPIRDLVSNLTNPPEFQYYGLASPFHDLDVVARLDVARFGPVHVVIDGDVVKNLAFNRSAIAAKHPVNNIGPVTASSPNGQFDGGSLGYQAGILVGYPDITERWQWSFGTVYKYLPSDATPDAFTYADFHLGGTNAKGYVFTGTLGVAHDVSLAARWLSATEVSGPPYTVNVVQVDLNARY